MNGAYNNFAQASATDLNGRRANFLRNGLMPTPSERLREIRERSGLTIRAVASFLEFETHSRYSYYESARFKGDLPVPLARRLAWLFQSAGIQPEEVMQLAGLNAQEASDEAAKIPKTSSEARPLRIFMEVQLPNEASLTRMFDSMLESAGVEDLSGDVARTLALLLPASLAGTAHEFSGESLDPDFRPVLEARSRSRAKSQKRLPPA